MHEVVAQAGTAVCDAAICEGEVEFAEHGWDMDEEEAVEKTYRSVPESRQSSEESYERDQGHCDGEDDDGARDCHDERSLEAILCMAEHRNKM